MSRDVATSVERLHAIEDGIRQVLGDKQLWLTPEEFLANVEAHRRKHDQERRNPKPINHKPASVREYPLKRPVVFSRQMEFKDLEAAK